MRYSLICYIINLRRNSLCQVKETITQKQFKLDAINYRNEHPDLTQVECAKNLGIGVSTLANEKVNFVIMTVTFPFVAQVTINLMMQKK